MKLLPLLPCFAAFGAALACAAGEPQRAPNLFAELLGKTEAELDAKLEAAWRHFFAGDPDNQRLYFETGDDTAYIADTGHEDVRSEGMSYGMMIAVQLDKQTEFDRLWRWANRHMRHTDGPRAGYFAWHCRYDGTIIDPGSASDGEEWIAMALFFASHRWGDQTDGEAILNYGAEAQRLLRDMLHKPLTPECGPIFNREQKQVTFVPGPGGNHFTDPSYHLPAFYELWARWADDESDRAFWAAAAATSRMFFKRAAHPVTGLMPEYAHYDGTPFPGEAFGGGKDDFRFDAWRTLANVALDHTWWRADPWQVEQSNRVLRFLRPYLPDIPNQFSLDGRVLSEDTSSGLIYMGAVAGLAADPELARDFVQALWDSPMPEGRWRYYNGLLYCLALLQTGGRFEAFAPAP